MKPFFHLLLAAAATALTASPEVEVATASPEVEVAAATPTKPAAADAGDAVKSSSAAAAGDPATAEAAAASDPATAKTATADTPEKKDAFDAMVEWFERECVPKGGYVAPLYRSPVGLRGTITQHDIKENETVLAIPPHCCIHESDAQHMLEAAGFGGVLAKSAEFDTDNLLELALLVTKDDPDHFFAPYFATLPTDFSNYAPFWPEDQVAHLPPYVRNQFAAGKERLERVWVSARAAEPAFARFTFEQFAAARVLVRSRWFLTQVKGQPTQNALIPFGGGPARKSLRMGSRRWRGGAARADARGTDSRHYAGDAPNHADAPSLDYNHRFDTTPKTYDYKADYKIAAGGEVTILYGHFTPSAFLADYGFTQDGDHPRSVLHVEVDKKPLSLPYPSEELKKSIETYGVVVAAKTMKAGRGGASQKFLASIVEAGRRAARAKVFGAWREDLAVMAHRDAAVHRAARDHAEELFEELFEGWPSREECVALRTKGGYDRDVANIYESYHRVADAWREVLRRGVAPPSTEPVEVSLTVSSDAEAIWHDDVLGLTSDFELREKLPLRPGEATLVRAPVGATLLIKKDSEVAWTHVVTGPASHELKEEDLQTFERGESVEFKTGPEWVEGEVRSFADNVYEIKAHTSATRYVRARDLRPLVKVFEEGDRIRARYQGGQQYFNGMIAKVHSDKYDIKYDDGDEELHVDPKYIQRVGTKRPPRVVEYGPASAWHRGPNFSRETPALPAFDRLVASLPKEFAEGDRVLGRYARGRVWFPATVDSCVEITIYGALNRPVGSMAWRCRFLSARRSQHGRAIAEKWHPTLLDSTQVESVHEGKFDLVYDDGEREQKIFPRHVVSIEQFVPAEPEEIRGGDYVLAQKKADKAWYHGRVTTVRARTQDRRNATYDVALGDYTAEEDIPWRNITVLKAHIADCDDAENYSDGTNGCAAYERAESRGDDWCARFGSDVDSGQGKPIDRCCACGGGTVKIDEKPPLSFTPEPAADLDDPRTRVLTEAHPSMDFGEGWFWTHCIRHGGILAPGLVWDASGVRTSQPIMKGDRVARIPRHCLVSAEDALKSLRAQGLGSPSEDDAVATLTAYAASCPPERLFTPFVDALLESAPPVPVGLPAHVRARVADLRDESGAWLDELEARFEVPPDVEALGHWDRAARAVRAAAVGPYLIPVLASIKWGPGNVEVVGGDAVMVVATDDIGAGGELTLFPALNRDEMTARGVAPACPSKPLRELMEKAGGRTLTEFDAALDKATRALMAKFQSGSENRPLYCGDEVRVPFRGRSYALRTPEALRVDGPWTGALEALARAAQGDVPELIQALDALEFAGDDDLSQGYRDVVARWVHLLQHDPHALLKKTPADTTERFHAGDEVVALVSDEYYYATVAAVKGDLYDLIYQDPSVVVRRGPGAVASRRNLHEADFDDVVSPPGGEELGVVGERLKLVRRAA